MKKTTKKGKKKSNNFFGLYVIICVILGIAISFLVFGILETKKEKNTSYMNDLINIEDNVLKHANLKVYTTPYGFAEYENTKGKFYIVKDSDYLYIVYLDDEQYEEIIKNDLQNDPYIIEGYTNYISEEIQKLAIESYNELLNSEEVTEENFELFFGSIYLDATASNNISTLYYVLSVAFFLIGSITFIFLRKEKKKY